MRSSLISTLKLAKIDVFLQKKQPMTRVVSPQKIARKFLDADFTLSSWESVLPYFEKLSETKINSLEDLIEFCQTVLNWKATCLKTSLGGIVRCRAIIKMRRTNKAISSLSMKLCRTPRSSRMLGIIK